MSAEVVTQLSITTMIVAGLFELGRLGGSAKGEAKTNAAKLNGLKGGRPPKHKIVAKNVTLPLESVSHK